MSTFFNKYLTPITSTLSLLAISNLICVDAVQAFSTTFTNGGFESSFSVGWTTTGDASRQGTFQGIAPPGDSNHALITTACPGTANANGECYDTHNTSLPRIDDSPTAAGTFNKSGSDQISASIETSALQNFLGLSPNALSIARENGQITGTRTPKEGSAIKQTFAITESGELKVNFKWNYLTNDGANSILGDQDFAFVTLYRVGSNINDRIIIKLDDSTGSAPALTGTSTDFGKVDGYQTFTRSFGNVSAGDEYVLGFGVVDVDGTDRSSALLLDNVETVPFEFSPSLGLILVAGMFGCDRLRRKLKSKSEIESI